MTASERSQLLDCRVGTNNATMKTAMETTPDSEISATQNAGHQAFDAPGLLPSCPRLVDHRVLKRNSEGEDEVHN